MSSAQRAGASELARRYARCYNVDLNDVVVKLREDEDAEVWAPGVGAIWTLNGKPYESTLQRAGVKR